jgi:hypothetical protein
MHDDSYVHKNLHYSNVDIGKYNEEQHIEACALKVSYGVLNICLLTIYRAPIGNFNSFLYNLDSILQSLYTPVMHIIICGDINTNYLNESANKSKLDNLLLSYNLTSLINFPTRVQNTSATAVDNIFLAVSHYESYAVTPIINGMSNHDTQLLTINTNNSEVPIHRSRTVSKINKYTISNFIDKLSSEIWDPIFSSEDVNAMFNFFLNTYLRIFYSSFPLKKVKTLTVKITTGLQLASKHHADTIENYILYTGAVIMRN